MPCPLSPFPEELRLLILSHVPPADLWLNVRHVNRTYRSYAEDVAIQHLLPNFTIGLNFTLSSSTHHKWYDVRGTVHHGFVSISRPNPQFALFERVEVLPKNCKERVLETWNRMCLRGFGKETEWRVTFPPTGLLMKMECVVMNEERNGLWCDWRELLDGYYERLPAVWKGLPRDIVSEFYITEAKTAFTGRVRSLENDPPPNNAEVEAFCATRRSRFAPKHASVST